MGISGRIAQAFLRSKLTPLVAIASLAVGLLGILATPREEEPQISVPMIDVMVAMPGASPREAENLLARPIEQRMLEIPGVDHVYAMSGDGYAMVTVRFKVGEDQERSVYRNDVAFYAVYILEAHPSDVWQMQSNVKEKVVFASPKSLDERDEVANSCVRKLGIKFPAILDEFDNTTEKAYTGWPDRLYLIDRGGKVQYKSKPGPFGFHPEELQKAIESVVAAAH